MKRVTIIGGGATGTLLTINLIKQSAGAPLEINLIEKKERLGRGVAYSTVKDFHLLNVPAAKMGAFPDRIEHFHEWLTTKGYNFSPSAFVSRRIYGEYLRELFWETVKSKPPSVVLNMFDDEAVDITFADDKAEVFLGSGRSVPSDKVVLAFGNFLPPHPKTANQNYVAAEKYFQNPWSADVAERLDAADDVLAIGTGLTMVDFVMSLYHAKHTGRIFAVSTHGLLPAIHKPGQTFPAFNGEIASQKNLREMLKIVREKIAEAREIESGWRAVIDALRPVTQQAWRNLDDAQKRRFMRHLRRVWDVSRHRMPPECADVLREMQFAGKLEIIRGRVRAINVSADGSFEIICSSKGAEKILNVGAVVNCTGSESDFSKIDYALVKNLIGGGIIKPDNLKLGIDATPDGRTITKSGEISDTIYTVGTALKGVLWESTAMPEIRAQASNLAAELLS